MAENHDDEKEVAEADLLAVLDEIADERPDLAEKFEAVAAQLGRPWAQLETIEHAGYLLFPDVILKRGVGGSFIEQKIMVRVPRAPEMRKARARARELFLKDGLDPKEDRIYFEQFENIVILSMAIRNCTKPYEPLEPEPTELEKHFDLMSLQQVWEKLDGYNALLNPQPDRFTRSQFLAIVSAIAEGRTIVPLDVINSSARATFIITMASLLHSFLTSKSSSDSSAT